METFTVHSTRSAATSAAKAAQVPVDTIIKTAGWSGECSFAKYYDKPLTSEGTFAEAILTQATVSEIATDNER